MAKSQAKAKEHPETEHFLLETFFIHDTIQN